MSCGMVWFVSFAHADRDVALEVFAPQDPGDQRIGAAGGARTPIPPLNLMTAGQGKPDVDLLKTDGIEDLLAYRSLLFRDSS
jgi:hypothetical protein